jgi:hypothetical protein
LSPVTNFRAIALALVSASLADTLRKISCSASRKDRF